MYLVSFKIQKLVIKGTVLERIKSFILDREMSLRIKENFPDTFKKSCGVPQGFCLGPILLILFINDITQGSNDIMGLVFADDLKIY